MVRPSIRIKLGIFLKNVAMILKAKGIKEQDDQLEKQSNEFIELVEISWNDYIGRAARTSLEGRKWNKPKLLPLISDLQILGKHLKDVIATCVRALDEDNNDVNMYRDLQTSLLTTIILFNRRRSGEPAKMEVAKYHDAMETETPMNYEVRASLSTFERKLCSCFKRIELRGKHGKKVPVLLTKEMQNGMALLIKLRKVIGTNPKNPYVFGVATNQSRKYVRGCDAMRKHVQKNILKCPEAIYATNLRKHVATLSQIINLAEMS